MNVVYTYICICRLGYVALESSCLHNKNKREYKRSLLKKDDDYDSWPRHFKQKMIEPTKKILRFYPRRVFLNRIKETMPKKPCQKLQLRIHMDFFGRGSLVPNMCILLQPRHFWLFYAGSLETLRSSWEKFGSTKRKRINLINATESLTKFKNFGFSDKIWKRLIFIFHIFSHSKHRMFQTFWKSSLN